MAAWIWVLIAIIAVAVVALAATVAARQRRTRVLQEHFGPEYDRTVQAREDQRAAEAELRDRERQRAQLSIKPLPETSRARFGQEWREVQEQFVDQPARAVAAADSLLQRVLAERGYRGHDFESQASLVSVDYPGVVADYRAAHGLYGRSTTEQISTEDLRAALLHYRSLFGELLRPDGQVPAEGSAAPDRPGIAAGTQQDSAAGEPEGQPLRETR